jgi:hypothetical protein
MSRAFILDLPVVVLRLPRRREGAHPGDAEKLPGERIGFSLNTSRSRNGRGTIRSPRGAFRRERGSADGTPPGLHLAPNRGLPRDLADGERLVEAVSAPVLHVREETVPTRLEVDAGRLGVAVGERREPIHQRRGLVLAAAAATACQISSPVVFPVPLPKLPPGSSVMYRSPAAFSARLSGIEKLSSTFRPRAT